MTSHDLAETRILTETTCFDCYGRGYVPDKDPAKRGHVWDCPKCSGKKVTRRAVTLAELRDALTWAPSEISAEVEQLRERVRVLTEMLLDKVRA